MSNTFDTTRNASGLYTFSGGNLVASKSSATDSCAFTSIFESSGRWVFSFTVTFTGTSAAGEVGMGNASASSASSNYLGIDSNSFGVTATGGFIQNGGGAVPITGYSHATGAQVDIAVDIGAQLFWIRSTTQPNWNGNAAFTPGDANGVSFSGTTVSALSPAIDVTGATSDSATIVTPPGVSGFLPWGFVWLEDDRIRRGPIRWGRRPEREEFILNPTQTAFKPWGFEEDALVRRVPRRFRWTARNIDPNEFIFNPTQTVFEPWGFEEESLVRRVPRRTSWRARPEPLREEFIKNPTQTVFQPWGFDEEQHKLEGRVFHRAPQQEDPLGIPQLVGVPWSFDEEQHKPERAIPRRAPQQEDLLNPPVVTVEPWAFDGDQRRPIRISRSLRNDERTDGLLFTAATPVNWPDIDEPPKLRRRSVWRKQAIEEFLFNPTQIVFASWGFDEEQHGRKTRVFHRAAPTDSDALPFTAATPLTWADIEQPGKRRVQVIRRGTPPDDLLPAPVAAVTTYAWGFEEEPQRVVPRLSRRKPRTDDILGFAFQVVGTETVYYDEEPQRAVPRRLRPIWRAYPQPSDNEGWPFSVIVPSGWGGIEQGLPGRRQLRQPRRVSAFVDNEDWIRAGIFPPTANWGGNVWWVTASGNPGDRAWVSIGIGPNPAYQARLRSLYLVLSGSSAASATMVVRDGPTQVGTVIFEADLYTAANSWDFLDFNEVDLRASVGNVLTVEFIAGTPGDVQEINAGGDYVAPGTLYGV